MKKNWPALLVIILLIASCEFKNEEELFQSETCDTSNLTYASVKPIFESNCVKCHNNLLNNRDIKLNTYANAHAAAESGLLIKAVNHLPGVTPMPYLLNKLDSCSVRKISLWIQKGSPE